MLDLGLILTLLIVGYFVGSNLERKHFRSIIERESNLRDVHTFSTRHLPPDAEGDASLVAGNVVISIDYFKKISAGLRGLIGGRVSAYESLVERARREAVLRMKLDARQRGATSVWNVKLETSSITKGSNDQVVSVEVLAYGTALRPTSSALQSPTPSALQTPTDSALRQA